MPPNPPKVIHRNALLDAINRALEVKPSEREAAHWGFICDDNLAIALFYEYDDERKPLKISNIPIEHDTSIYADEIKKSINTFYGSEISPVEYMEIDFDNFRTFANYVCNTDHYVEMSLKMKNMTTGEATLTAETRTEGCYFFREDEDYLYDIFYDQYEEINSRGRLGHHLCLHHLCGTRHVGPCPSSTQDDNTAAGRWHNAFVV